MTLQIKAEVLLNNSNWERNLKKTSRQMDKFGKSMKTISRGIGLGLATFGISSLAGSLEEAAKAADDDAKSMRVLNKVLVNNWKATTEQTKAVDDFLQKTSVQVGILDDQLRPAFAKIATTTKNPTKAMERFKIALDVAAGTGKDLNVVSQAMAKYFGGQTTALDKLVPGIKNAGDKIGYMTDKYKGAAEAGAGAFDKINVAVENAKESIGAQLLPEIEKFAKWLGSDEGQKAIEQWISDLKTLITLAKDFLGVVVDVTKLFQGKRLNNNGSISGANPTNGQKINAVTPDNKAAWANLGQAIKQNVTINVNAPYVSGAAVLTAINGEARRRGVPLSKLLG